MVPVHTPGLRFGASTITGVCSCGWSGTAYNVDDGHLLDAREAATREGAWHAGHPGDSPA